MRHPRYRRYRRYRRYLLGFGPRSKLVKPRFYRIRADHVAPLFAILMDPRNDAVPHTHTWRQHAVIRHQMRSRHQRQLPLNENLRGKAG